MAALREHGAFACHSRAHSLVWTAFVDLEKWKTVAQTGQVVVVAIEIVKFLHPGTRLGQDVEYCLVALLVSTVVVDFRCFAGEAVDWYIELLSAEQLDFAPVSCSACRCQQCQTQRIWLRCR